MPKWGWSRVEKATPTGSSRVLRFRRNGTRWCAKVTFEPGRGTVTGRAALERRAVHVADIASDPEYALAGVITVGNMRTALGVPLVRESEPVGVL